MTAPAEIEIVDCEWIYAARGHHDPTAFLAAVDAFERNDAGLEGDDLSAPHLGPSDVSRVFYISDPRFEGDDEQMRMCEPTEPGAEAWTIVQTP